MFLKDFFQYKLKIFRLCNDKITKRSYDRMVVLLYDRTNSCCIVLNSISCSIRSGNITIVFVKNIHTFFCEIYLQTAGETGFTLSKGIFKNDVLKNTAHIFAPRLVNLAFTTFRSYLLCYFDCLRVGLVLFL